MQMGTVGLNAQQCLATWLQARGGGLGLQLLVDQRQALRIEELVFQPMACPRCRGGRLVRSRTRWRDQPLPRGP